MEPRRPSGAIASIVAQGALGYLVLNAIACGGGKEGSEQNTQAPTLPPTASRTVEPTGAPTDTPVVTDVPTPATTQAPLTPREIEVNLRGALTASTVTESDLDHCFERNIPPNANFALIFNACSYLGTALKDSIRSGGTTTAAGDEFKTYVFGLVDKYLANGGIDSKERADAYKEMFKSAVTP